MSYQSTLASLRDSGNFRQIPASTSTDGIIDLTSNDYLGLATRTDLIQRFLNTVDGDRLLMSSAASRLLAGRQEAYHSLEDRLSNLYNGRSCLVFNSGYHANTGMISALASEPSTLIIADKLVHASIIDGIILSRAPFKRFAHNDFNRLETLLQHEYDKYDRIIIVVESVYSMDGDRADLEALTKLKQRYPKTILYVDEAHAFGVNGPKGLGLSMECSNTADVDIIVGTFGKAAASVGAFIATSQTLRDYAINRARSFIFSTAIPPINCAWTSFILDLLPSMEAERQQLQTNCHILHRAISHLPGSTQGTPSHIIPYIVGSPKQTIDLSSKLLDNGYKTMAIRTPTVPRGTERLRISISAAHRPDDIKAFADTLTSLTASLK